MVQAQEVFDLFESHGPLEIGLVIENEQSGAHELLLLEQLVEFISAHDESLLVGGVDDPNEPVGFLEEVAPVGADGLLAADVPERQLVALEIEGFDLEAESGRNGVDVLVVELLDDGGLAWS